MVFLSNISIGEFIAEGSFGRVYRGRWNDMTVAFKKSLKNNELIQEFEKEAVRLSSLNHSNIGKITLFFISNLNKISFFFLVRFLGICKDAEDVLYLVTEFITFGEAFFPTFGNITLSTPQLLDG